MNTHYYVWGSGRWREVDSTTGSVAGWAKRPHFVFVRRGRLRVASRRRVLAALQALAAGRPSAADLGPRLSASSNKPEEPQAHAQRTLSPFPKTHCHHHHCCAHSHGCNNNITACNAAGARPAPPRDAATHTVDLTLATTCEREHKQRAPPLDSLLNNTRPTKRRRPANTDSDVNSKRRVPNSPLPNSRKAEHKVDSSMSDDSSSDKEVCKELTISESDVLALRSFVARTRSDALERFDADDDYKRALFYAINPLVNVKRCAQTERALRERSAMAQSHFAARLGLRPTSASTADDDKENRKRTRTKRHDDKAQRQSLTTKPTTKNNIQKTKHPSKAALNQKRHRSDVDSSDNDESENISKSNLRKCDSSPNNTHETDDSDESSDASNDSIFTSSKRESLRRTQNKPDNTESGRKRPTNPMKIISSSNDTENDRKRDKNRKLKKTVIETKSSESSDSDSSDSDFKSEKRESLKQAVHNKHPTDTNNINSSSEDSESDETRESKNKSSHKRLKKNAMQIKSSNSSDSDSNDSDFKSKKLESLPQAIQNKRKIKNTERAHKRPTNTITSARNSEREETRDNNKKLSGKKSKKTAIQTKSSENSDSDSSDHDSGSNKRESLRSTNPTKRNVERSDQKKRHNLHSHKPPVTQDTDSDENRDSVNPNDRKRKRNSDIKPNGDIKREKVRKSSEVRKSDKQNVVIEDSDSVSDNKKSANRPKSAEIRHKSAEIRHKSAEIRLKSAESSSKTTENGTKNAKKSSVPMYAVRNRNGRFKKSSKAKRLALLTKQPKDDKEATGDAGSVPTHTEGQQTHVISKRASASGMKEYSNLEDHAIVAWVSAGGRARRVNGNLIWRELQDCYEKLTGHYRSWHSLRNRYLRYILPSLGALCLPPGDTSRLRAAAATGEIKHKRQGALPARRNSMFKEPPASAAARRPALMTSPPRSPRSSPSPPRLPRSPKRISKEGSPRRKSLRLSSGAPAPAPATAPGSRSRKLFNPKLML